MSKLRVQYPNTQPLRSVGRVAVIGVLLRLRVPMAEVEQMRAEIDRAIARVGGPGESGSSGAGTLTFETSWDAAAVRIAIAGPLGTVDLTQPR